MLGHSSNSTKVPSNSAHSAGADFRDSASSDLSPSSDFTGPYSRMASHSGDAAQVEPVDSITGETRSSLAKTLLVFLFCHANAFASYLAWCF